MYVKICGLTTEAGVDAAVEAGADAVGFVLCASPRQVSVADARRLRDRVPASMQVVAVVRHANAQAGADAAAIGADLLQGEGALDLALPAPLRRLVACRTRSPAPRADPSAAGSSDAPAPADPIPAGNGWLLLDGPRPGSGRPGDLDLARRIARTRPLILAGGLGPDNVAEAVRLVRPAGVDVSSGVERRRGDKDPALIHSFVHTVRQLEDSHEHHRRRP